MKKLKIISFCVFFIFIGGGFFLNKKMAIEHRKYKLISKEGKFEIRFYPPAIIATTTLKSSRYSEAASPGFRKLAGYIFGSNQENKKIAMTSPVELKMNQENMEMSFTMPSEQNLNELPKPNDPGIRINKTIEEYTASIEFGGYASDDKITKHTEELKNILIKKKIIANGSFRFLGYNSPFKLLGRKNEIIVPIVFTPNLAEN
jgi:hypothetical protein